MAKGRTPKDRTAEIQAVFDGLKFCSADELKQVIEKANSLIDKKRNEAIKAKEEAIAELQRQIEELKK